MCMKFFIPAILLMTTFTMTTVEGNPGELTIEEAFSTPAPKPSSRPWVPPASDPVVCDPKVRPASIFLEDKAVTSSYPTRGLTEVKDPRIFAQLDALEQLSRHLTVENLQKARATGIPERDIQEFLMKDAEAKSRAAKEAAKAKSERNRKLAALARELEITAARLCDDGRYPQHHSQSQPRIVDDEYPYVKPRHSAAMARSQLQDSDTPAPVFPISADRIESAMVYGRNYSVIDKEGREHTGVVTGDSDYSLTIPADPNEKPIMKAGHIIMPLD